jgi:hypothetical protein
MFAWLGSGRTRRNKVGLKGRLLDEAARARLPVPDGAVLLDAFYHLACREGLVLIQNGRLEIPDPPYLSNTLYHGARLPRFNRPVVIRPAFSKVDAPEIIAAFPDFEQQLSNVQIMDAKEPTALALALGRVWSAAIPLDETWRRDTLIMQMIKADIEGTAVTGDDNETDAVYHAPLTATGDALYLPQISGWQRPDDALSPYARRLQQLLRGVRRTFGRGSWRVDWADDGEICWLIKVFPTSAETV